MRQIWCSTILKFDVHSAFAISRPIYEIQNSSINSFHKQISVNVYMHISSKFVSYWIKLARSKAFIIDADVWISFEQKTFWSSDCCFHLPLKSIQKQIFDIISQFDWEITQNNTQVMREMYQIIKSLQALPVWGTCSLNFKDIKIH